MKRYKILTLVFALTALASCVDEDISMDDNEIPAVFTDGYALNLKVTLDNMGGGARTRAAIGRAAELEELESYIDPEKFRVLFFDREDRFLFESKSRWAKKIEPDEDNNDYSQWLVSVPIYAYGNDESADWNWEQIRRVLTGEDKDDKDAQGKDIYTAETKNGDVAFKIAILANRSLKEWNMGLNGRDSNGNDYVENGIPTDVITKGGYSINNGPNWTTKDTRWGNKDAAILQDDNKIVRVYNLHHCQYDPILDGKNWEQKSCGTVGVDDSKVPEGAEKIGRHYYMNNHIYDFISDTSKEVDSYGNKRPWMGASSSWIDWGENDNNRVTIGDDGKGPGSKLKAGVSGTTSIRKNLHLSKEHPIPMYGIQQFGEIKDWVKGTPFNLSKIASGMDDTYTRKSISLLRSVVKLELVLDFKPDFLLLYYSNIYSRCEPMDVWTPTEEIWKGAETHQTGDSYNPDKDCEWYNIIQNGPVSGSANAVGTDVNYSARMAWFYGAWLENKFWNFEFDDERTVGNKKVHPAKDAFDAYVNSGYRRKGKDCPYPKIFNTCVQRLTQVFCDDYYIDENGKYHYIVYTGERNMNDPSTLTDVDKDTSGAPTICYWMIQRGGNRYGVVLADYNNEAFTNFDYHDDKSTNPSLTANGFDSNGKPSGQTATGYYKFKNTKTNDSGSNLATDYAALANHMNGYEQEVQKGNKKPWPLLRNHVYKITIGSSSGARSRGSDEGGLSIRTEESHSKSIKFD